jgi:two-component system sensor histidine kinase KdpD
VTETISESKRFAPWWQGYLAATVLVLVAMLAALAFQRLPHANLSLLFLLAVLIVAAVWGLWPSIFGSALGFLTLNFFFTTPRFTLNVAEEGDVATLVFFLAMASLTGNLAARMRTEMAASRRALDRVSTLLDFSSRVGSAVDADQALTVLTGTLHQVWRVPVAAWRPDASGSLRLAASTPAPPQNVDLEALSERWRAAGRESRFASGYTTMLLAAAGGRLGFVTIATDATWGEQGALAEGLCEQAAIAVERALLADDLRAAQIAHQTERLRSALLSSVSHDLKTPLASIIGSVSSVLEYRDRLSLDDQRELLQTVLDESQRLNRYIQNLLDMTRFGQSSIEVERGWVDINDLISAATERLGSALSGIRLQVNVAHDVSLIFVQGTLIEQALVNILDNAADFSEPGDMISIDAYLDADTCIIDIVDQGPGIAEEDRARVFDMFFSAQQGDRRRHGVGLGLAICSSILKAHGGTITTLPGREGRGTCVRMSLPSRSNLIGGRDA